MVGNRYSCHTILKILYKLYININLDANVRAMFEINYADMTSLFWEVAFNWKRNT